MSPVRLRTVAATALASLAITVPSAGAAAPGDLAAGFTPLAKRFAASGGESATGVALRHDGRIVVSAVNDVEYDRRIVGLRADGTLDPTFSEDGVWHLPQPNTTVVRAVATQPDGKVVFAGDDASQHTIVVGRLMRDGELDPTFGGDGLAVFPGGANSAPFVEHVEVQADGRIFFAGELTTATNAREVLLGRLNPDGTDDPAFQGAPYVTTGFAGSINDQFAGITRMDNGEFAVGVAHETAMTGVIRVGPTGNYFLVKDLDASSGVEMTADVASMGGTHVLAMSNAVAGETVLMRIDLGATPRIDTTWGTAGTTTPFPEGFKGEQLLRQPDGSFLVSGYAGGRRAIARVLANGSLDARFGAAGMRLLDGSSSSVPMIRTHELAVTTDGFVVSAANVRDETGTMVAVDKLVGRIARVRAEVLATTAAATTGVDVPMVLRTHNAGPDAAGRTRVTVSTSPGLTIASSDGACAYHSATSATCTLTDIPAGASRDITVKVRTTTAGGHSIGMHVSGTTWDDDRNDDSSTLLTSFAAPTSTPTPGAGTGTTPTGPGAGPQPGSPTPAGAQPSGPRAVKMFIRRLTARNGRALRCGFTARLACATPRVRSGRRTVAMWMRITSRPAPGTAKRRVWVQLQRREGRRWVKRGDGTLDLRWNGTLDLTVPTEMRYERSQWRLRVFAPATRTTKRVVAPWFYITVR